MIELYPHQQEALEKMHDGCILCGEVGSGKSLTALAYFYIDCGGSIRQNGKGRFRQMARPIPLYIITTAKKRDSHEWEEECARLHLAEQTKVVIDSWNNIKKYEKVSGAFFIFDEQRVVGYGAWVKAFLKISRRSRWILLSATPGDTWTDYIPVFVANGFYRNKTEFCAMHAVYSRYSKYPKIERFLDEDVLEKLRDRILVNMPCEKKTVPHHIDIRCEYDKKKYLNVWRDRWDPYKDEPIPQVSQLFYCMRRVVNEDRSRLRACSELLEKHQRAIIFYNFNYELLELTRLCDELGIERAEWNGEKHNGLPTSDRWVYLVQYAAGAEGWNCTTTDTMIFFSQNYSYRMTAQAAGRIDRLNTPYVDLYYYHLKSYAPIDLAIAKALKNKKKFNERAYFNKHGAS